VFIAQGTYPGSFTFVDLNFGNDRFERILKDLTEATIGPIGKTAFLFLKMIYGARFLGDWFGEQKQKICLKVNNQLYRVQVICNLFRLREVYIFVIICKTLLNLFIYTCASTYSFLFRHLSTSARTKLKSVQASLFAFQQSNL
jgi:hypothetical protein